MPLGADLICYIVAVILFAFAAFEVRFGRTPPGWALVWEWLAFMVLTISLVV